MNELTTRPHRVQTGAHPNRYSAKNNVKPVRFFCYAPHAKEVALVGDFNGWNPLANRMKRRPDGPWAAEVELHHGHHHYLFQVDDELMLDPQASGIARNARNERVSLVAVS